MYDIRAGIVLAPDLVIVLYPVMFHHRCCCVILFRSSRLHYCHYVALYAYMCKIYTSIVMTTPVNVRIASGSVGTRRVIGIHRISGDSKDCALLLARLVFKCSKIVCECDYAQRECGDANFCFFKTRRRPLRYPVNCSADNFFEHFRVGR